MSATVLLFDEARRKRAGGGRTGQRAMILDAIAQGLMADFACWPWVIVDEAIRKAAESLDAGGSFLDAIEASEQIMLNHKTETTGSGQRLKLILQRRERRQQVHFCMAARIINRKINNALQRHHALLRARRIIEGGGSINAALYGALGNSEEASEP